MDLTDWLIFSAGSAALCAATWAGCRWWYGRQIALAVARLAKSEKAQQFANLQVTQARKQIEKLQKDMAALHLRAEQQGSRAERLDAALRAGDAAADRSPAGARPRPPAHGFADTEPMEPARR